MHEIHFGKRLRYVRFRKQQSQFNLEADAGLAPGSISRIENNHVNPSKETLYKIASSLGLDLKESIYLFGLDKLCKDSSKQLQLDITYKD